MTLMLADVLILLSLYFMISHLLTSVEFRLHELPVCFFMNSDILKRSMSFDSVHVLVKGLYFSFFHSFVFNHCNTILFQPTLSKMEPSEILFSF